MRWSMLALGLALSAALADEFDILRDLPGAPDSAEPEPEPEPETERITPNGHWRHRRPDGGVEYLELFGRRRFVYRSPAGQAVAGEAVIEPRRLHLRFEGLERIFYYDLGANLLRLTPDSTDTQSGRGELAAMHPRGGETAVYTRRGMTELAWELSIEQSGDLIGRYRSQPVPQREESLELRLGGQFVYQGPGGLRAAGRYNLEEGLLVLRDGAVERRLIARVTITSQAWVLSLTRDESDLPPYLNDLADMAPRLRRAARFERPLLVPTEDDLLGSFRTIDELGEHRLVFAPNGQLRVGSLPGEVMPGTWSLDGALLRIDVVDDRGIVEVRRFVVQPIPGGLLLVRDDRDEPLRGELLRFLPPLTEPYARYTTF